MANNVMPYPWELPFTVIMAVFMLAMSALGLYQYRKWRKEQRQVQQMTSLTARRELQMADTWPVLPTVRPAYEFDHSDTSEAQLTYCPACALESVAAQNFRDDDGFYPMPRGTASFCLEHAVTWHMRAAEENA